VPDVTLYEGNRRLK